ncbi:hypothetical protein NBH00_02210 [Paraconexibacter antarcticus]|uniref:Uncharacterized protein n=1 Tax=Paraconexibacter antarcticus TaxID=2949664 RepID=A0ABY5DSP3_9ACTN|nr:hypothetical protein [Paraconexibacter antarcticus]UTI65033.1 hypothetical protein NBH00_02210 [Paraconexibacter antarcticus]
MLAAAPVPLLLGAPLRDSLAQVSSVPSDSSIGVLAHAYWHQLGYTLEQDLRYPADTAGPLAPVLYLGLAMLAALLIAVALRRPRNDAFWAVQHGTLAGSALLLLLANNPQGFRLELVLVPAVAAGVALVAQRLAPTDHHPGLAGPRAGEL